MPDEQENLCRQFMLPDLNRRFRTFQLRQNMAAGVDARNAQWSVMGL